MRPIMISECSGCGCTLEHDQDPRTVLCGGCEADKRIEATRGMKPPPPTPPPMRSASRELDQLYIGILLMIIGLTFGMAIGWKMAGGN